MNFYEPTNKEYHYQSDERRKLLSSQFTDEQLAVSNYWLGECRMSWNDEHGIVIRSTWNWELLHNFNKARGIK